MVVDTECIGLDLFNQATTGEVAATITVNGSGYSQTGPSLLVKENREGKQPMTDNNEPYTIGHDIRSSQMTCDGKTDTLSATDYKDPIKVLSFEPGSCSRTGGHVYKDNKTGTLRASMGDNQMSVCNEDSQGGQMLVRRLTPLECERLQGFPDNWTNIGEWTDTKGKKHKTADTPRYKALGNSIALPFWEWLAQRICDTLRAEGIDQPTMASLFDGIGGFPLVFSRCGCEPVWASEIEEFPIAVTKYHFPENDEEATTDDRQ